jgi:hypothetical protein
MGVVAAIEQLECPPGWPAPGGNAIGVSPSWTSQNSADLNWGTLVMLGKPGLLTSVQFTFSSGCFRYSTLFFKADIE